MTKTQIVQIILFRASGMGPSRISKALGIHINTVISYCRRHPMPKGMMICKNCGEMIELTPGKKIRQFCSDRCRYPWWNKHRYERKSTITKKCAYCGNDFKSYESEHRLYCSRDCYHKSRNERVQ